MSAFGVETILKVPPHPSSGIDTANNNVSIGASVRSSAVGAASTSDNVLNGGALATLTQLGVWITWCSDTDCYIHFQPPGGSSAASSTNSLFLPAGVERDYFHRPNRDDTVFMIQKTAGGRLYRWQSSP